MISLVDIAMLFFFSLVIWTFYRISRQREQALKFAQAYCLKHDIQLLDENVAIRRIWIKRDKKGTFRFWLLMEFEFSSTGDERYRAKIIMLGGHIANIIVPPYLVPSTDNIDDVKG